MTISTQDCKDFIGSISGYINSNPNDTWKRIKKYKEGDMVLRDFENQEGRKLTIAEEDSSLFIYQLSSPIIHSVIVPPIDDDTWGKKLIGRDVTEKDVFKFIAECVEKDNAILGEEFCMDEDNVRAIKDGVNSKSWYVLEKWSKKIKKSAKYGEYPLKDFINDNDGDWGEYDLYYADDNGNQSQINPKDLIQVFWVGMTDYDTAYRIYVFETKDHTLFLGVNNSD